MKIIIELRELLLMIYRLKIRDNVTDLQLRAAGFKQDAEGYYAIGANNGCRYEIEYGTGLITAKWKKAGMVYPPITAAHELEHRQHQIINKIIRLGLVVRCEY